jgi:4-aminobutyrate aminotransferase
VTFAGWASCSATSSQGPTVHPTPKRPAAERDLLLLTCGPRNNVARMIPALVVDDAQIDQTVAIWADAVEVATSG